MKAPSLTCPMCKSRSFKQPEMTQYDSEVLTRDCVCNDCGCEYQAEYHLAVVTAQAELDTLDRLRKKYGPIQRDMRTGWYKITKKQAVALLNDGYPLRCFGYGGDPSQAAGVYLYDFADNADGSDWTPEQYEALRNGELDNLPKVTVSDLRHNGPWRLELNSDGSIGA